MQQPSSLIFLAIVVIWAAYLLQHWIRRREALATARSVDQFSDAMRVLERRERPIEIEGIAEQASDTSDAGRPSAPRTRDSVPRPSLRAGTVMTGEVQPPVTEEPIAPSTSPAGSDGPSTRERLARIAATAGSPKLRAIALVASIAILLITIVCAPFGALPWWSPILMLAVSGGVFYWCRASAMAAAAARRPQGREASRPAPGKPAGKPAPQQGRGRRAAVKLPKRKVVASPPVTKATMPAPVKLSEAVAPQPAEEQVFDVSASVGAPAPATAQPRPVPVEAAADAGDGWQPVAVPPPTYTMKERAPQRPQQAPAPTSPKSYEHVANEDLPFDGLALDQDLDDLPSVFRAG